MSKERLMSDVVLDRLMSLHPKLIDLSLGRIQKLLKNLGNPECKLPPIIHIAGTNGKGSVAAFLRAMFEADGKKVHVYTSPHLIRFHERIRVAGDLISEDVLAEILEKCEVANDGAPITFFEITTAAAFLAFANDPAEVLVLETGLGGRLDATNVIKQPKITAITPISMDHRQFLGDQLAHIAWEKAGIIKPGVPLILSRQAPEADKVIRARAAKLQAPVYSEGVDWNVNNMAENLVFSGSMGDQEFPLPSLIGTHQFGNAGTAIAAFETFNDGCFNSRAIMTGLVSANWPARLHRLTGGKISNCIPKSWELWLDGGHNLAAGSMLADHASINWEDRPLHIIVGMMKSKDTRDFLCSLARVSATACTVSIPGESNSHSAEELAESARLVGLDAYPCNDVVSALEQIRRFDSESKRVLICGSLYLAGTVLAAEF